MNAHDNSEAPMAYTRKSVVAYLLTAEQELARIRLAISEARGRTARARDRAGRLSVLKGEVEDGTGHEDTPIPVGAQQPVATAPTASALVFAVPIGTPPLPEQALPLAIADMPVDPLPHLSARPIAVPDTTEPVNAGPGPATDDPTRPWRLIAPLSRVADD
jgi:hypothetical protein